MKIDVVVGNPPYQESNGGGGDGKNAIPLYHKFIKNGIAVTNDMVCMITPSRWFTDTRMDALRDDMIGHLTDIVHYMSSYDVFKGADINFGVSYFLYKYGYTGKCHFTNHNRNRLEVSDIDASKYMKIFRFTGMYSIVDKVYGYESMSDFLTSKDTFKINSNLVYKLPSEKTDDDELKCLFSFDNYRYIHRDDITQGNMHIDKYKLVCGTINANRTNDAGMTQVIQTLYMLKPGEVCSMSYYLLYESDEYYDMKNCSKYIRTKFARSLINCCLQGSNFKALCFKYVPMQNFHNDSDIDWSDTIENIDRQLYKKYGLTENDIEYIENLVTPLKLRGGIEI